jgi:hypothetical protein
MKLRVWYVFNGNVKAETLRGHRLNWHAQEGVLDVEKHDKRGRLVWTKVYYHPVSAELWVR